MMMKIGKLLSKARKNANLSQVEAGNRLGWGQSRISNYERDEREPTLNDLNAMAELYGCELNSLIDETHSAAKAAKRMIDLTAEAAHIAGSSRRRTEYAIAEIAPGQLGENTDIVQRIPLINFSDASDVDNAISRSEHSLPIWVRPGKPKVPVYSDEAFGLLMDTEAFAPAIPKDSVLVIEPNTDSGHNDWCFLVLSGNRTAIAKAYPGLTATDLTIQAVGNDRAPISEWPDGAQLKGFVKNVLFP